MVRLFWRTPPAPILVVISYGMNDQTLGRSRLRRRVLVEPRRYRQNVQHIIRGVRQRATSVLLVPRRPHIRTGSALLSGRTPEYLAALREPASLSPTFRPSGPTRAC